MKTTFKRVLLTVMALAAILMLTACGKTKLELDSGISVRFGGMNGDGYAEVEYPDVSSGEGWASILVAKKKVDLNNMNDWTVLMAIDDAVTYEVTPDSGLSNGDKVTLTITPDGNALKKLGFTAKPIQKTYTVEGLQDPIEVDAFRDFEVEFQGTSPFAQACFSGSQDVDGTSAYYSTEDSGFLKLGDTVTVTAKITDTQRCFLKEESKDFTVSGVDSFVMDIDDVSGDVLAIMREKADAVVAQTKQELEKDDTFAVNSCQYVGYGFMHAPEAEYRVSDINKCGILYQMETTYRGDSNTFYYTVLFTDLIQHPDGTQSIDLDLYKTPSALLYRYLYANTTPESALNDCKGWKDFEIQLKLS